MKKAQNDYIGVEKISEPVKAASGIEFSGKESTAMPIQRGKITMVPERFKDHFHIGHIAYYNKAKEFSFKITTGETMTMVPIGAIALTDDLSD